MLHAVQSNPYVRHLHRPVYTDVVGAFTLAVLHLYTGQNRQFGKYAGQVWCILPSRRQHGKMSCGHVKKTGETQNYITIFIDQPMRRIDVLDGDAACDAIRRNGAKANRK
jgi:hypothetical protein